MITSAELVELQQLLNSDYGDPHHILGMHSLQFNGTKILTVRAFVPQAKKIEVFDPLYPDVIYPMEKVHVDGFFEGLINDRDKWFRYMLNIESIDGNKWTCYDAYSFFPTVNETDKYLFCEGTHYEIYNKLGAHMTELEGIAGVAFVVWAPNAVRVSVIGEFNCWDGRRNQMRNPIGSGLWEIFIPGLNEFDEYKYEIKTKSGAFIQKCDPYGFYAAQSPGTQSFVFNIDKYKWTDDTWTAKNRQCPPLNQPINIYEVHPGSWRRTEGDECLSFTELADSLVPYVKQNGYNYIELMPIQEHTNVHALGYQTTGYYAVTSRYGKPDELMYLIDKCHNEDIGVIMDWIPTQFPHDSHSLENFDGTPLYEHGDPRLGIHPVWGTKMFDYSKKQVKNFLLANALFWIEKYHVDGLRINNLASILYLDYGRHGNAWLPNRNGGHINLDAVEFLKHMNSIIEKKHPHILMIAEDTDAWPNITKPVDDGGLGFGLVWNLGWMHNFLLYMSVDPEYRVNHQGNLTYGLDFMYNENSILTLSHDEVAYNKCSLLNRMSGNLDDKFSNLRLALAFMIGHPGKKLTFMGTEFGQVSEWSVERSLDWGLQNEEKHIQLVRFVKDLNMLYLNDKTLWEIDFSKDGLDFNHPEADKPGIILLIRHAAESADITIFVYNFTDFFSDAFLINVPKSGKYTEILNSDSEIYGGKNHINDKTLSAKKNKDTGKYELSIKLPALGVSIIKPNSKK